MTDTSTTTEPPKSPVFSPLFPTPPAAEPAAPVHHAPKTTPVTFGPSTINFGGDLMAARGKSATPAPSADPEPIVVDPYIGLAIKLNMDSPGGTLPTGLDADTVYWIAGHGPNYSLTKYPGTIAISFTGGSGANTAAVVDGKHSTQNAEAIVLLHDALARLAVNALSDVGAYIGRAIAALGG